MMSKKYILSPCGTSLLTNQVKDNEERKLVFNYANEKSKDNIPHNDKDKLEKLIQSISTMIDNADYQQAAKMSAELNGIIKIYGGSIPENNDFHLLLSTDTWLGEETAKLVEKWLKSKNKKMTVSIHRQTDLQTKDMSAFQLSLSELVKKFDEELPEYFKSGYKIIFNLTGGFKSVIGFLQSLASFYAAEVVYIFETSSELLRIPRLPIKMDASSIIENKLIVFRKLSLDIEIDKTQLDGIPETLLLTIDDQTILSPWGELIFKQYKKDNYDKALYPSPIEKIKYSKRFESDISDLDSARTDSINRTIDQLAKYFNSDENPSSLDFKKLKGNTMAPSTYEMDAWSDKDARRIFGHYDREIFILDKLDKGLH